MSLTKASPSMIQGARVSVLDFIAQTEHAAIQSGTSTYDATSDVQAALAYAQSLYVASSQAGSWLPDVCATLVFPRGKYNVGSTLEILNITNQYCHLEGFNEATIQYTGATGNCISIRNITAAYSTNRVTELNVRGLSIHKGDKAAGSVGLYVERVGNIYFGSLDIWGFDYGVKNLGGISNIYDFQGKEIVGCNIGIYLTQQALPSGFAVKSNLVNVSDCFFAECSTNAIFISTNPDDPAPGNAAGGVISIRDCDFASNSSDAAIKIESPGEHAQRGIVNIDRCWFEAHGERALYLINGTAVLSNCYIVGGTDPITINVNAYLVLLEFDCYLSSAPTNNFVVNRDDASPTPKILTQIYTRTAKVDAVPPVTAEIADGVSANNLPWFDGVTVGRGAGAPAYSVAVGFDCLAANVSGDSNTAFGGEALFNHQSGNFNVAVGEASLYDNLTGQKNTAIGRSSGYEYSGNTSGSNNSFIGFNSVGASATASNAITLGDANITTLRCQVTSITSLSDARDKTDVVDLPVGLDFISKLRPVKFTWSPRKKIDPNGDEIVSEKTGAVDSGFIAQELMGVEDSESVADILKLTYRENPDALEASAGRLIPVLVKAIQELKAEIDLLKSK